MANLSDCKQAVLASKKDLEKELSRQGEGYDSELKRELHLRVVSLGEVYELLSALETVGNVLGTIYSILK